MGQNYEIELSGLELCWRISRIVIDKVLDDKNFNYKWLKEPCERQLKAQIELAEKSDDDMDDVEIWHNYKFDPEAFQKSLEDEEKKYGIFDYDSIPDDLPLEEIEFVMDQDCNIFPRRKRMSDQDEMDGLKWVCIYCTVHS